MTPYHASRVFVLAVTLVGCGAADDNRDPVWSYISPAIIQPNCATASCHNGSAAVSGLNLATSADGHISLTELGLPGMRSDAARRNIVVAGNPDQSRLVRMLRGDGASRMPPDRPLPESDIRLIEQWIRNGAKND